LNTFAKISSIDPYDRTTFSGKVFLTFDVDWASDEIVSDTLDILHDFNVESTWFITHESDVLERLRSDQRIEVGIHPNFNPFLDNGKLFHKSSKEVIANLLQVAPEATAVRSHSLSTSSKLKAEFREFGLTHHCNLLIPFTSGNTIWPFYEHFGLIEVPHQWEDDVHSSISTEETFKHLSKNEFTVFDFHPIHVFLNSNGNENYKATKHLHQQPNVCELLKPYIQTDYGTKDSLLWLLNSQYNQC
jgi:hypothetical protein